MPRVSRVVQFWCLGNPAGDTLTLYLDAAGPSAWRGMEDLAFFQDILVTERLVASVSRLHVRRLT